MRNPPDGQRLATIETVLLDLPDRPIATTRGRNWGGLTLDLHAPLPNSVMQTRPRDHHVVIFCPLGSGRVMQRRGGQAHESALRPGMSLVLPAGQDASWEGDVNTTARLRCPVSLIAEAAAMGGGHEAEILPVFEMRDPVIEQLARLLMAELDRAAHPSQGLIAEAASLALAAHLLRVNAARPGEKAPRAKSLDARMVERVTGYMEENIEASLSLNDLARVAEVSRFHFLRLFKRATGTSPMAYLEQARLRRAQEMIRGGALPLAEIALRSGFADQSHFTRRFKNQLGCTPMEFARTLGLRNLPRRDRE
ncbi:helix-turn-helix transcriptional regulator [Acetobacteraceae bacterium H6797]|nr:helix-turn-helix transcriptional regulator [Acetobacteraceae bacterium H6797]